jgi:hypothetical protein
MKVTRRLVLIALLGACIGVWFVLPRLEQFSSNEGQNYTLIDDGLYMGGLVKKPPRHTQAVLNLCEVEDPYRCDIHLWEPIRDAEPAPDLEWLRRMVEFVDAQRRAGRMVYVHCAAGISRSGMVIVAYLMFKNHWTRDEALAFVRTKRDIVRPNPAFMELLAEWEKILSEKVLWESPTRLAVREWTCRDLWTNFGIYQNCGLLRTIPSVPSLTGNGGRVDPNCPEFGSRVALHRHCCGGGLGTVTRDGSTTDLG